VTNPKQHANWMELESRFKQLQTTDNALDSVEWSEVMDFVRANEFGIALDTLLHICKDKNIRLPELMRHQLIEIAQLMALSPDYVTHPL
jgi:hypothetical protein